MAMTVTGTIGKVEGMFAGLTGTEIEGYEKRLSDVESLITFSKKWLLDALEQ